MESMNEKEFIDIVSKSFTLNQKNCMVCRYLPIDKLCEATLDILFDRRSFLGMSKYYTQFATELVSQERILADHRFKHHAKKCCKDKSVFTTEELKKIGIIQDEYEFLQRLYNLKYEDIIQPDIQKNEIRRQRLHNLEIFENERRNTQKNIELLKQNILPELFKDKYKSSEDIDFITLIKQESAHLLTLTKQIDIILSDLEKNLFAAERAAKANTTVIQVVNSSISEMERKFMEALDDIKSSLEKLLPNQPEVVKQVLYILVNHMNNGIIPVIERTKEVLQIEK